MISFHYGLLQAIYWMLFAAVNGFATVFLLGLGLKESTIGLLIALSNVLAAILQPLIARWIDRSTRFRLKDIGLMVVGAILMVLIIGWLFPAVAVVTFLLAIILIWTLLPMTNSLAVYYIDRGEKLNFGIARAAGSGFYGLISLIMGFLIKSYGTAIIPLSGLFMTLALGICLASFRMSHRSDKGHDPYTHLQASNHFVKEHRAFIVFLFGIILLFTFHTFTTTYLIHIVRRVGGDASTMGVATAIMAAAEIPVLMFSNRLIKRFGAPKLLITAGVFWALKAVATWLAPSIASLYLIMLLQAFSYAPLIPASIYYTNSIMKEREKAFGQALVTAGFTLGGVLGSLSGGFLVDYYGVPQLLMAGSVIAIMGALTLIISLNLKEVRP